MEQNVQFLRVLKEQFDEGFISINSDDLKMYGADWSGVLAPNPMAIAFPRSTDEVSRLLKLCSQYNIPVVPSGGRTGLSGGAVAAHSELVLSLSKMNRLGQVDARARTLEVEAGAITEQVHHHCANLGLTWPVDFASKGSSQVGGNISTNAGGVRVIRYGLTRNWVIGLKVVLMTGEVLDLMSPLEKNNTGLDLKQLFIGTEGTLGVITEANLRLAPIPKDLAVGLVGVKDFSTVLEVYDRARSAGFTVSAFECLSRACFEEVVKHGHRAPFEKPWDAYILIEAEDSRAQFEQELLSWLESGRIGEGVIAQSDREKADLWKIREAVAESILMGSDVHQQDISVPIRSLVAFSNELQERYTKSYPKFEVFIFGHIGDGNLHVFIRKPKSMDTAEFHQECKLSDADLFKYVQKFGGSISAEHGIGILKKDALPYSRAPFEIEMLKKVKSSFDAQGLLNPGKIF